MYIPILKNRSIEISVIKELLSVGISDNTIPLIEVIQPGSRSNSKTYSEELDEIFTAKFHRFFLDIPKLNVSNSTAKPVQEFMTLVNRQKNFAFEQIVKCKKIPGIIPVLSYNMKEEVSEKRINFDISAFREHFTSIALRISHVQYKNIKEISSISLVNGDFLLFDIADKSHTNPIFKNTYREIASNKKTMLFTSAILNSNRPSSFYNKNITDGEPIEEIDNSLFEMFKMSAYKFDAFGDYACVSNTLPSSGGAISPAGIYYSAEGNFFVGYKGRTPSLSEFYEYISPSIVKSQYWHEFDETHHNNCPGCIKIQSVVDGGSGKSQGVWKGITMAHYIYTIDRLNDN